MIPNPQIEEICKVCAKINLCKIRRLAFSSNKVRIKISFSWIWFSVWSDWPDLPVIMTWLSGRCRVTVSRHGSPQLSAGPHSLLLSDCPRSDHRHPAEDRPRGEVSAWPVLQHQYKWVLFPCLPHWCGGSCVYKKSSHTVCNPLTTSALHSTPRPGQKHSDNKRLHPQASLSQHMGIQVADVRRQGLEGCKDC